MKNSWHDFLAERHEKEDGPVRRFYEQYKSFGRGHFAKVPLMEKKIFFKEE